MRRSAVAKRLECLNGRRIGNEQIVCKLRPPKITNNLFRVRAEFDVRFDFGPEILVASGERGRNQQTQSIVDQSGAQFDLGRLNETVDRRLAKRITKLTNCSHGIWVQSTYLRWHVGAGEWRLQTHRAFLQIARIKNLENLFTAHERNEWEEN